MNIYFVSRLTSILASDREFMVFIMGFVLVFSYYKVSAHTSNLDTSRLFSLNPPLYSKMKSKSGHIRHFKQTTKQTNLTFLRRMRRKVSPSLCLYFCLKATSLMKFCWLHSRGTVKHHTSWCWC